MTRFGFLSNYLSETLNLNSSLKIQDSDSEKREREREKPIRERRKPRTALPEDFQPNERAIELAKGYGLNIHKEMAAFRDFHMANGSVFKDWQAAFRTWLRKALYFSKRGA
jgi:hypothetical protein